MDVYLRKSVCTYICMYIYIYPYNFTHVYIHKCIYIGVAHTQAVRACLRCAEGAIRVSLDMQRVAGNQILEIRIRDGANGLSMVAARYLLRNPTQDLLSELVGHTLSKIAELLAELGVSAGEIQHPIIMSSDGEGKEVEYGRARVPDYEYCA